MSRPKSTYSIIQAFSVGLLLVLAGSASFSTGLLSGQGEKTERTEIREDREARDKWFLFQRTYPFDSIPIDARRKAWEARPRSQILPLALGASWRAIGPAATVSYVPDNWGNTSGRINAIAISPLDSQLVLVGSSSGGIWRSTDGGMNFKPVTDDQVDLSVGSIAFSSSNPAIVYAGMGGDFLGTGVLRSTDAGMTWRRINNNTLAQRGQGSKIAVDPTDSNRVYLAQFAAQAADGNVFSSAFQISLDGGINWRSTLRGLLEDLAIHPTNPRILYLAISRVDEPGNRPAGLYRSMDGGNTWSQIFIGPFDPGRYPHFKIGVTHAEPQTIYLYAGGFIGNSFSTHVEVSTDGGMTWEDRGETKLETGFDATYLAVNPANASELYVGHRDLYKSVDGGRTWANLSLNWTPNNIFTPNRAKMHIDQHSLAFLPDNSSVIYVGNDGGLSKSSDGGMSFDSLNGSLSLTQFYAIGLHPNDPAVTYGGSQDNGFQRRLRDSSRWRELITGDYGSCVFNPLNPSLVFTNYIFGSVFRYDDRTDRFATIGKNSTFGESENSPRIAFLAPMSGNGVDAAVYFGTWRVFVSTDLGNSWSSPSGTTDLTKGVTRSGADVLSTIGIGRSNPAVIYTGSAQGRAMVSIDGGRNWKDVTNGLPNRFITGITMDGTNSATAYLSVSGFRSGHVFKTINTGATWTDISGNLPDIPCNALLVDPLDPTTIYVGTDIGVFRSTSGRIAWETFNNGIPPVIVRGFTSHASGLIQVGTHGRGAYELIRG